MTTALHKGWVTKQVDFSNAFAQAPVTQSVFMLLPAMFGDMAGIDSKDLCLELCKSLCGLREAPKLWADFSAKGLEKAGFRPLENDPGIHHGHGMASVAHADDSLLFGPDEKEMNKVLKELEFGWF